MASETATGLTPDPYRVVSEGGIFIRWTLPDQPLEVELRTPRDHITFAVEWKGDEFTVTFPPGIDDFEGVVRTVLELLALFANTVAAQADT